MGFASCCSWGSIKPVLLPRKWNPLSQVCLQWTLHVLCILLAAPGILVCFDEQFYTVVSGIMVLALIPLGIWCSYACTTFWIFIFVGIATFVWMWAMGSLIAMLILGFKYYGFVGMIVLLVWLGFVIMCYIALYTREIWKDEGNNDYRRSKLYVGGAHSTDSSDSDSSSDEEKGGGDSVWRTWKNKRKGNGGGSGGGVSGGSGGGVADRIQAYNNNDNISNNNNSYAPPSIPPRPAHQQQQQQYAPHQQQHYSPQPPPPRPVPLESSNDRSYNYQQLPAAGFVNELRTRYDT